MLEYLTFLVQQQWHPVGSKINPEILYKLNEWGLGYAHTQKMFLVIHGHLVWEPYIFNSLEITVYLIVIVVNRQSKVASCLTDQDMAKISSQVPATRCNNY